MGPVHAARTPGPVEARLLGVLAELRRLAAPSVAATALACLAVEAVTTAHAAGQTVIRAAGQQPAAVLQSDTLTGALRISATHAASLCGLLLVAAVTTAGTGGDYEAGTFGILLLAEPRRRVLFARKLVAGALAVLLLVIVGALLILLCGTALHAHYTYWTPVPGPSWADTLGTLGRASLVAFAFLTSALAAATLTRSSLGALAAFLGPVFALAPATRTGLAPLLPHYWISAWMGYDRAEQFQTYLWNSASSRASVIGCGIALAALAAAALAGAARGVSGDRLLTSAG